MNHQEITRQVIECLRNDQPPWRQSWSHDQNIGLPTNIVSKRVYRGVNNLLLQMTAKTRGYISKWWATEKQWQKLGGKIRFAPEYIAASDWATRICCFNGKSLLGRYQVYNVDQVAGVEHLKSIHKNYEEDFVFDAAESVIAATGAVIKHGGMEAKYLRPPLDYIRVPEKEQFTGPRYYYSTVFHELAHWAECRIGWNHRNRYALGELVAEMAAIFMCHKANIPPTDSWQNHYTYLNYWIKVLSEDDTAIFAASAQASKVADFIFSFYNQQQKAA